MYRQLLHVYKLLHEHEINKCKFNQIFLIQLIVLRIILVLLFLNPDTHTTKLLGILVLNALQLRTLFGLFNFFVFERHWWVFCRRNERPTYMLNLVLVSMMSLFTTTWSMPLLVEIYFPEGITSPVVSTFCADMNCQWYGYI